MGKQKLMQACVHTGDGRVHFMKVPVPDLRDVLAQKKFSADKLVIRKEDLVLLRVEAASICGTDLHILEGKHDSAPPVILGHEYVGRVLSCGSTVEDFHEGDFVAVDPNIKCGICRLCRSGRPNMCENMTTLGIFLDGGFAEYNLVPAKQLYKLPDLQPERAVFFEPLSCVVHGLGKLGGISAGESVLIYGGGPIGCLFTALCCRQGASLVLVVEPYEFRHEFVQAAGGLAVLPGHEDKFGQFDVVVDASGAPNVIPDTIAKAKEGARVLWFGQQNVDAEVSFCPTVANQKELQIYGSYAAATSFEATIKILADPKISFERLISHRLSLHEIERAFELMEKREALKVLIDPKKRR